MTVNLGCCDFQLRPNDSGIICARSMEFPIYMDSKILTFNRGEAFASTAPDGTDGLKWTSKYGFVGMNAFGLKTVDEGLNEAGLSYGCLSLDCSTYASVPNGKNNKALAHMDLGMWILGSFSSVDEVKAHIKDVIVWGQKVQALGQVPGLHFAIHDKNGNNLVIEFIDGQVEMHDNEMGVLTNDPPYQQQLENLAKYNNITAQPAPNATINGQVIKTKGMGSGLLGMPGDLTPQSRFVRVAKAVQFATSDALYPETASDAFKAATHILNSVDKLKGSEITYINNKECYETTLWATIKHLTDKTLCYRSYGDMAWRRIDLKKINFAPGTVHNAIPVQATAPTIIDMTDKV